MNASECLNIGSEVGQKFARRALFDLMQSRFELHPGRLVKDIRGYAEKNGREDVAAFIEELRDLALVEADQFMSAVHGKLTGSSLWIAYAKPVNRAYGRDIWERLCFSVEDAADGAASWCEALDIKPGEFVQEAKSILQAVIRASFDKAAELHSNPRYQA